LNFEARNFTPHFLNVQKNLGKMDPKNEIKFKSMIKHPEWDLKRIHDTFDHWEAN